MQKAATRLRITTVEVFMAIPKRSSEKWFDKSVPSAFISPDPYKKEVPRASSVACTGKRPSEKHGMTSNNNKHRVIVFLSLEQFFATAQKFRTSGDSNWLEKQTPSRPYSKFRSFLPVSAENTLIPFDFFSRLTHPNPNLLNLVLSETNHRSPTLRLKDSPFIFQKSLCLLNSLTKFIN